MSSEGPRVSSSIWVARACFLLTFIGVVKDGLAPAGISPSGAGDGALGLAISALRLFRSWQSGDGFRKGI